MDIEEKIIDYINNELSTEERQEVSRLIESDDMARSLYDEYQSLMSDVREEPLLTPDQDWVQSFSETLKNKKVQEPKVIQLQLRSVLTKVAAAAVILVIGVLGYNNINQSKKIDAVSQEVYAMRQLIEEDLNLSLIHI